MTPFVNDPDFQLHVGDALEVLQAMPAESVHCCVTSPPYWGLRDYGTGTWAGGDADCDHRADDRFRATSTIRDTSQANVQVEQETKGTPFKQECGKCGATRVDQQLGLEPTPDEYVASMVEVFREVRRVLRADGTLWLNIGDSYAAGGGFTPDSPSNQARLRGEAVGALHGASAANYMARSNGPKKAPVGLKPKDLVGIPWRLAFALQADGWYLRSDIIWSKPNPMPESVTDRPTKAHEYLFLLTKSPRYFYDADAIREPQKRVQERPDWLRSREVQERPDSKYPGKDNGRGGGMMRRWLENPEKFAIGRNKRSVWEIATEAYPDAHFATFPQALVEPCIKAGTSEHGCCPECGAPWERRTERSREYDHVTTQPSHDDSPYAAQDAGGIRNGVYVQSRTIGWRPTCDHYQDLEDRRLPPSARDPQSWPTVPCVVLDPFLGSGTTAQVARRLGRRCVGIELNPEYAELAARRLQQQSLFA